MALRSGAGSKPLPVMMPNFTVGSRLLCVSRFGEMLRISSRLTVLEIAVQQVVEMPYPNFLFSQSHALEAF